MFIFKIVLYTIYTSTNHEINATSIYFTRDIIYLTRDIIYFTRDITYLNGNMNLLIVQSHTGHACHVHLLFGLVSCKFYQHVVLITSLTLSSSKKWIHKAIDKGNSDYDSELDRLPNEQMDDNLFHFTGLLNQMFAFESLGDALNNAVCSPAAVLLPIGKLILGAATAGLQELIALIGVDDGSEEINYNTVAPALIAKLIRELQGLPGATLHVATRIYVPEQSTVYEDFITNTYIIYRSNVERISFKEPSHVVDEINGWVSRQTCGKIPLILNIDQITPNTSSVIINAIYFQGKWKFPFKKVVYGDFFAPSGQKNVQYLSHQGFYRYGISSDLNAQIIEIPYKGMKSSMIIFLPHDNNGVSALLNKLKMSPYLLNKALKTTRKHLVSLSIPKFGIQTTLNLKSLFKRLGLQRILSNSSGLLRILKNKELHISTFVQKAFFEVRDDVISTTTPEAEEGPATETPDLGQKVVVADHPFLFYVKAHKEQLMVGILSEPT